MRMLRQVLGSLLLALPLAALAAGDLPAARPAQYSFADVYRLTVNGGAFAEPAAPAAAVPASGIGTQALGDYQLRLTSTDAEPVGPRFSIGPAPEARPSAYAFSTAATQDPERWALLLSGVALAIWVARRRLGYSL